MSITSRYFLLLVAVMIAGCSAESSSTVVPLQTTPPTRVPADIRAVFEKPLYAKSTWGLRVLDGKKVLVDFNSHRQFLVGSIRKVFDVGALLNAVGPAHTYDTPVYRTGSISHGVLHGNLIVVASGDLTMGGRTNPDGSIALSAWDHTEANQIGNAILTKPNPLAGYDMLADAVKAAGITRIDGNVVIDDRLFVPFRYRQENFYVRPIFVNDDCVDLSIVPGGKPGSFANVSWRPKSAALEVANRLRVGGPVSTKTLEIRPIDPTCIGKPNCTSMIAGILPNDYKPPFTGQPVLVQTVRITDPSNYARTVFVEELAASGVTVNASAVQENPVALLPPKGRYRRIDEVARLTGLPYADDAKYVLKNSYNVGAEMSLLLFGLTQHVDTREASMVVEQRTLRSRYGIPSSEYHFVDGSGGGDTTATNVAVTQMLEAMDKSRASRAFVQALAIMGVDGTVAYVRDFRSNPSLAGALGKIRIKTGTLVGLDAENKPEVATQAYAGYINTKRGHRLAYQLVVNHVPIKELADVPRVFQDQGTISAILWRDF